MNLVTGLIKKSATIVMVWSLFSVPGPTTQFARAAQPEDSSSVTQPLISIQAYKTVCFSPVRGETFPIPVIINRPKMVEEFFIEIRTADNDLVDILQPSTIEQDKTNYLLKWDGMDRQNQQVPDEAYIPILVVRDSAGRIYRYDPRSHSGGEEVYDFEKSIRPGVIEYNLPVASRILIRSGIKNGPMLRTVIDWKPRTAGFHAERWSGRDEDNVVNIEQNPQAGYLILGYQLPDHSIITFGNQDVSYRQYRERNKWPLPDISPKEQPRERGDKVIRTEFYTPVLQQKSPRIYVNMLDKTTGTSVTAIEGMDEVLTAVKLDPLDELYLDQERYEISFFVDNEFVAEEEQGFVPFTWRWSPGRYGIKPGHHVLTINVTGYKGQAGVRNLAFTLKGQPEEINSATSQ